MAYCEIFRSNSKVKNRNKAVASSSDFVIGSIRAHMQSDHFTELDSVSKHTSYARD